MRISDWSSDVCSSDLTLNACRQHTIRGREMQRIKLMVASTAVALMASSAALANDELLKMQENPNEWVMPTGNYANWRYSELDEITKENVGDLQVAWTFSTGVLRGHEGGRTAEPTSELQSLMRISYAVFCLKNKK